MKLMRLFVFVLMLLPLLTASALATSSGGATTPGMQVAPGHVGQLNGVTVHNGNTGDLPQFANSKGKATLRKVMPAGTTDIDCENKFQGAILGLKSGDTVSIGSNSSPTSVVGTGGSVTLGHQSSCTITCQSGPGSLPISVTLPGGGWGVVLPGNTATYGSW